MNENELFFVGQKAFIEKDGKLLILSNERFDIDFPGGRIQTNEREPIDALKREVKKETELEIEVIEPFITWISSFPEGHKLFGKRVFIVGYRCKLISNDIKLNHEHTGYKWVGAEDYKKIFDDKSGWFYIIEKYFREFRKK